EPRSVESPEQRAMGAERVDISIDLTPVLVGVVLVGDLVQHLEHPESCIPTCLDLLPRERDHSSRKGIERQRRKGWDRPHLIDQPGTFLGPEIGRSVQPDFSRLMSLRLVTMGHGFPSVSIPNLGGLLLLISIRLS